MEEFLSYNIHVTHINPILKGTGRQLQQSFVSYGEIAIITLCSNKSTKQPECCWVKMVKMLIERKEFTYETL